jgi:hypothetical protein
MSMSDHVTVSTTVRIVMDGREIEMTPENAEEFAKAILKKLGKEPKKEPQYIPMPMAPDVVPHRGIGDKHTSPYRWDIPQPVCTKIVTT